MIKSMTGFGRELMSFEGRDVLVEIRSVNHRYYEFSARLPKAYGYLETKLKEFLNGKIARGKVEISVSIYHTDGRDIQVQINESAAKAYVDALRQTAPSLGLNDNLELSDLMRLPDVFVVNKVIDDEDEIWQQVKTTAEGALNKFISMREVEGETLKNNILEKLALIQDTVEKIKAREPQINEEHRTRLYEKIKEVLGDTNIDESRILTEAAIYAEKTAVDEETVRLISHISQFKEIMEAPEAVGRKLDFLMQEMNREANTTGSKIQDTQVTNMVISIKSELEKIREQIQNIE